jgi:signal transduction histidine kinase
VRAAQPFDKRAVELARAFADQAVVALENARLYQEAREAYEELSRTQEQLLQAQKMEAVGQLAGGVAHDFNNLLTVIVGRSELVLDALPAGDPLRTHVELSLETAERASTLVQQLLAFSRRQVLQPRVLDLNRVVVDMTKILQRLIGEDIVTTVELGRTLWRVKADPGQLEQVILNLAVNARDAMPRGGRLVIKTENVRLDEAYVRQHAKVRAGPYVRLTVSDTGVGMDAAVKGRMFEPFFTTKGPGKGTGLGLATVYGIVQQSGGHIAVESEPGRGTTFWVYLPRLEETVDTLGEKARAPGEGQRGSENVLLVEDDEEVRAIARIILETVGYRVLAVASPAEALATLARHGGAIDLLLTDVVMPEMSGPELAQRVRALRPDLRVLYMSGYTADAMLRHGIRETDVALLPKPFSRRALLTKVREVLDAPPRP